MTLQIPTKTQKKQLVEIDHNRIIQDCYFMNAEKENNWPASICSLHAK